MGYGARLGINSRIYEATMLVWRGEPGDLRHAHSLANHIMEASQNLPSQRIIALFAMARVQLARRAVDEALVAASEAHRLLSDGPVEEWDEQIRLCYVEALIAGGRETEADDVLRTAFDVVKARVTSLRRPELRESFCTKNEEVRELLELAAARLGLVL